MLIPPLPSTSSVMSCPDLVYPSTKWYNISHLVARGNKMSEVWGKQNKTKLPSWGSRALSCCCPGLSKLHKY